MKTIDILTTLTKRAPGRHLHQLEGYIEYIAETCGKHAAKSMADKRGLNPAFTARILAQV